LPNSSQAQQKTAETLIAALAASLPDPTAHEDLVYVSDTQPGIHRRRTSAGFRYVDAKGHTLKDANEIRRIKSLAIPPAYEDVWICSQPNGHLQATGRDARGRKQYRYHPQWRLMQEANKFEDMLEFGRLLPKIRARLAQDLGRSGLKRERVLATIVKLLDLTLIRVGNEDYARQNQSYGLTTLRTKHVAVSGDSIRFEFTGKSGKVWKLKISDRRIARVVKACHDLPGHHLFGYVDENGERHNVSSSDVNAYLRDASGSEITAKHFRTWSGSVLAAMALAQCETADCVTAAKRNIKAAIAEVSARLGNTPAVCRKSYIHPHVIDAYTAGFSLGRMPKITVVESKSASGLRPEEAFLLRFLKKQARTKAL